MAKNKVKLSITIEPEVAAALGPLQAELESQAYGVLARDDIRALHGPVRYSRSSVIQMAIMALCKQNDVEIRWPQTTAPQGCANRGRAMDLATGGSVEIPEGEPMTCSSCLKGIMVFDESKKHWVCTACKHTETERD